MFHNAHSQSGQSKGGDGHKIPDPQNDEEGSEPLIVSHGNGVVHIPDLFRVRNRIVNSC